MVEAAEVYESQFVLGSFDVVVRQSALRLFPDRAGALREMARVATPGGTVAVQVWDRLEAQEGYAAMYAAFARHLGPEAGQLRAPSGPSATSTWSGRCSRPPAYRSPPSPRPPPGQGIDERTYRRAVEAGVEAMAPFVVDGGRVELPIRGHIVTATRVG